MKNLIYLFIRIIIILSLFFGCKTVQQTTQPEKQVQQIERPKPITWEQKYLRSLSPKDSILFFNSTEIRLEGEFFNQHFFVQNGVLNIIDSINNVSNIVQKLTPGALIDLKRDNRGNIHIMYVSFSRNEITYNFSFFRTDAGTYVLNGKANLVFKGQKYPCVASTVGGECILLFYLNRQEVREHIEDIAPGYKLKDNY